MKANSARRWQLRAIVLTVSCLLLLSGILQVGTTVTAQMCNVYIEAVEFTQGSQIDPRILATPTPVPVALVDGRATTARVYARVTSGSSCTQAPIDADMLMSSGMSVLVNSISDNGPIYVKKPAIDRNQQNSTLNFTFISGTPTGSDRTLNFSFQLVSGIGVRTQQGSAFSVSGVVFKAKNQPDIMGVPIAYDVLGDDEVDEPSDDTISPGVADTGIWAMWPFPHSGEGGYYIGTGFTWDDSSLIHAEGQLGLLRELRHRRCTMSTSKRPDYIVGWLGESNPAGDVDGGSTPWRSSEVFSHTASGAYQGTFAHELGHTFDFDDISSEEDIDNTGWDVMGRLTGEFEYVRDTDAWVEIMNNDASDGSFINSERWPSLEGDGGYRAAIDDPLVFSTDSCPPRDDELDLTRQLMVIGSYTDPVTGTWEISSTGAITDRFVTSPVGGGDTTLKTFDSMGTALYTTTFTTTAGAGTFLLPVPEFTDTHKVAVIRSGQTKVENERSQNEPSLTINSPSNDQYITDTLYVEWSATDADGDDLFAFISISSDSGSSWYPISGAESGASLAVPTARIMGGISTTLRIAVTDGLNTTFREIDGLTFGEDRSPSVSIASPIDSDVVRNGAVVLLIGTAYDVEDGHLVSTSLEWYSDIDGYIGSGRALNAELSYGEHEISLVATDSENNTSIASVEVEVR